MLMDSDAASDGPVIFLKQGKIQGSVREGVARFLAIPYAAATSGDRRLGPETATPNKKTVVNMPYRF